MNNQFTQPKNGVSKETNKEAIARIFGVHKSEVEYLEIGESITGLSIVYEKDSQTTWMNDTATGTIISWSIVGPTLSVDTSVGSFMLHPAKVVTTKSLADPVEGDSLIGVIQPYAGAVPRTQHDKNAEFVSVRDFGAKGDGVTDDTVAFQNALKYGKHVYVPPATYIISSTLEIPANGSMVGCGVGYDKIHPTTLLLKGTGTKSYTLTGCTSVSIANPDAGAAYLADSGTRGNTYSTNDFTVAFSVGVILNKNTKLMGIGVVPYFNGVAGYSDAANFGMSDEWDVGIWARNADGFLVRDCIAQGHYRKAGLLQSSTDIGDGVIPSCERGQVEFSSFEGKFGISIRAPNVATADANYGFAGTDYINCYARGLWHNTAHLATSSMLSSPFTSPSGCMEIDGAFSTTGKVRGVQFLNSTFTNRDDIMIMSINCAEILFSGCYYESQPIKVNGVWLAAPIGCRMIATSATGSIWHKQSSQYGVDTTPYFSIKDVSIRTSGRYDPAKSGNFNPAISVFDDWQDVVFGGSIGHRLRNASQTFNINSADGTNVVRVLPSGNIQFTTTLESMAPGVNINRTDATSGVKPVLRAYGTGNMQLGDGTGTHTLTLDGAVIPYSDGLGNVGMAASRFGTVFAVTGTINTSDARLKTPVRKLTDAEIEVGLALADELGSYAWLDSIYDYKGADARLHFGMTVQRAIELFESYGLNAFDYGAVCYDKWESSSEVIPEVLNEDGSIAVEGYTKVIEAGDMFAFRNDELHYLILGAMRQKQVSLENRIKLLESK